MNLITFVSVILLIAGLSDWATERYPRLQRQIFYFVFAFVYICYTSKLYYGPDIKLYVYYYEHLPSVGAMLNGHVKLWFSFEWGFVFFCSLLSSIGINFWGLTAIISTLYFASLFLVLRKLEYKRCFAMMCILILDSTLVTVTLRQCLAVSMFLFMMVAWQDKKYFWSLVCMVLTAVFHKSGIIAVSFPVMFLLLHNFNLREGWYQLLIVLLIAMFALPIAHLISPLANALQGSGALIHSARHHLQLGRQIQTVFFIYMIVLILAEHYTRYGFPHKWSSWAVVAVVGMAVVVALYQYYYLLNRIRSYFLPIVVVYLMNLIQESDKKGSYPISYNHLFRQVTALVVFSYMSFYTYRFERNTSCYSVPLYKASTLLDLRDAEMWQVRNRQMEIADGYWKNDFMKKENNRL